MTILSGSANAATAVGVESTAALSIHPEFIAVCHRRMDEMKQQLNGIAAAAMKASIASTILANSLPRKDRPYYRNFEKRPRR